MRSALDAALDWARELIAFPTVSDRSNRALIEHVAARLEGLGFRVALSPDESGDKVNLLASVGPRAEGGVALSGHVDVVPPGEGWSSDPFAAEIRDGRLYGRGSCDMKGFVACALAMAPAFAAAPLARPVHIALTHDEETGCLGARRLAPALAAPGLRPAAAIVGEPTLMRVVDGHKGCYEYTTEITGRDGHGSEPDRGANAAEAAARYVAKLGELAEALKARAPAEGRFSPPGTTINVGRIEAGAARNVIAASARIEWEMRPVDEADAEFAKERIDRFAAETLLPGLRRAAPEAAIRRHVVGEVVGLTPKEHNPARDLVFALTGENEAGLVPFGTEAGLFQAAGIPAVLCGPGSIEQAHRPDEFVEIAQLSACLTMLERLAAQLCRGAENRP